MPTFSPTQEIELSDNSCLNTDCCCASPASLCFCCMCMCAKLWQELSLLVSQHFPAAALPLSVCWTGLCSRAGGAQPPPLPQSWGDVTAAGDEPLNERHCRSMEELTQIWCRENQYGKGDERKRIPPAVCRAVEPPPACAGHPWVCAGWLGWLAHHLIKLLFPLPAWGNAACVMLWMDLSLISGLAQLALPSQGGCAHLYKSLRTQNDLEYSQASQLTWVRTGLCQRLGFLYSNMWFSCLMLQFLGKKSWVDSGLLIHPAMASPGCSEVPAALPCVPALKRGAVILLFSAVCSSFWSWENFRRDRLETVFLNMDFLLLTGEGTEECNLQLKAEQIYTSSSWWVQLCV